MNEPFLCAMVTFDAETEEKISGFRRQLLALGFTGRQSKHLPPHITLGIFRPEQKEDAKLCTQKAAEHSKAFSLFFRHIGIFSGANVLFLAPTEQRNFSFCTVFLEPRKNSPRMLPCCPINPRPYTQHFPILRMRSIRFKAWYLIFSCMSFIRLSQFCRSH